MGLVLVAQKRGLLGVFVFFLGHILADLIWYSFISFSLSRSASRISLGFYKGMLAGSALLLVGFGLWFASYAVTGIRG
jgi:threonine/homoserine/homoserine lactone efflux protein